MHGNEDMKNDAGHAHDGTLSLDERAKLVVMYKPLLAEIIRGTQKEYKNMTREQIMGLIPGDGDMAEQYGTVLDIPGEKAVIVDTKVIVHFPGGEPSYLLLAIDIQGYRSRKEETIARELMYVCKLVSSRLPPGREYCRLGPTSIVWFDLNPHEANRGSILTWTSGFTKAFGGPDASLDDPGLIRIVYVGVDKGTTGTGSQLLDMADVIWNDHMSVEDRLVLLDKKYQIRMSSILRDGMESTDKLSEQFKRMGYDMASDEYEKKLEEARIRAEEASKKAEEASKKADEAERKAAFYELASLVLIKLNSGMTRDEALNEVCNPEEREPVSLLLERLLSM